MQRQLRGLGEKKVAVVGSIAILTTLVMGSAWAQTTAPSVPPLAMGSALVVVVRHAERATDDPADPTLTPAGTKRAEALVAAVEHLSVGAIITTHLKRTQLTAAPLAAKLGIKPIVVTPKRGDTTGHIAEVVAAVDAARQEQKGAIVVVGHSNTVPLIVKALSGVALPNMCEWQYADFYLIALAASDKAPARMVHTRYGDADSAVMADCR